MKLSLQKTAHFLLTITLTFYFLWATQAVLIPIAYAILLAFMIQPVVLFWQKIGINRLGAIILSFLTIISAIFLFLFVFATQIISVFEYVQTLNVKFSTDNFTDFYLWIESNFHVPKETSQAWLSKNLASIGKDLASNFGTILSSSSSFIGNAILVLTYGFLILLYRRAFKNFILSQLKKDNKDEGLEVMQQIQKVAQKYLYGLGLVILILGMLNTLGLWIIGLEYPYFWGFFAACMTIIPYIGTFIGAIFPIVYSLLTTDSMWTPFSVMLMFFIIQQLEGNLITPKIVGSSVKINPLAAILSMFIGWSLWGVSGVIMALPAIAIFKVICDNITFFNPIGKLLSSDIHNHETIFFEEYQGEKYSWLSIFKRRKQKE